MMKFLLILVAAVAVCSAFNEEHWVNRGAAPLREKHSVLLGVKLVDGAADSCDSLLMARSDPKNKDFGNHMSFEDMKQFTSKKDVAGAIRWLLRHRISPREFRVSPNREFIRVYTTVGKLQALLGVTFNKFTALAAGDDSVIFRAPAFELSNAGGIAQHIDFVSDVHTFPPPKHLRSAITSLKTDANGNVSPSLLHSFYNIANPVVTNAAATQAVFESLGQSFSPDDLASFQQANDLVAHPIDKVIGNNNPSICSNFNACGEASLDVQYLLAIAENATTWYWSIPGNGDIFLTWIEAVASNSEAPLVHSVSYGSIAPEDPKVDIERFDTEVCKLGLRGLTIVVSSGDDGVANFIARQNPSQCGFTPSFPATSRYVTTVGATQGPEAGNPEIACTSKTGGLITTGGGFSTVLSQPSYQTTAVQNYLANGPNVPPRTKFAPNGRAYPDVSMMGHNYPITVGGQSLVGSGTSASCPVFAGVLTLINAQRLAAGKASLGFINPQLYDPSNNGVYNDITSGENNCCAGQPGTQVCCEYGFTATKGWDPVTGWGSVDVAKLLTALA